MEFYDGRKGDKAPGNFAYVAETGEAHEDLNFRSWRGRCYAYAPIAGGAGSINITRLGAETGASYIDGVDVVFIAKAPDNRGVLVVGWYHNARVYGSLQERNARWFHAECDAGAAHRLDVDERWLRIENPPRRSNVWYADDRAPLLKQIRKLIAGGRTAKPAARSRIHDAARCLQVELAAYEAVISHYEERGYVVTPVWKDKKGWDLEARLNGTTLLIEVKGTEQSVIRAELTPNEYKACRERADYRICVVTDALSKTPIVYAFRPNFAKRWFDDGGRCELNFEERWAARLTATFTGS